MILFMLILACLDPLSQWHVCLPPTHVRAVYVVTYYHDLMDTYKPPVALDSGRSRPCPVSVSTNTAILNLYVLPTHGEPNSLFHRSEANPMHELAGRVSRPTLTTFVLLHGNVTDMFQGMWRLWGHEEMCIISKRPPETLIMGDQCIKVRSQQHINKKSQLLTGGK